MPASQLENQCRDARNKKKDVCIWGVDTDFDVGYPRCKSNPGAKRWVNYEEGFKFCPFCGKKIEVQS